MVGSFGDDLGSVGGWCSRNGCILGAFLGAVGRWSVPPLDLQGLFWVLFWLLQGRCLVLRLGAVLLGCCFGCFFGCCQGCVKVARILEGRTLTMNVKMRLLFLVCCKCALKSHMLFGVYSGVVFLQHLLRVEVGCDFEDTGVRLTKRSHIDCIRGGALRSRWRRARSPLFAWRISLILRLPS